jgi:5-methylcytosine-specific restriction endonuclease McrA
MNYKHVYMKAFNIGPEDVVLCEICGAVAVDIHHIEFKSQGGTDHLLNLIALCRDCHDKAHGKNISGEYFTREDLFAITMPRDK